MTDKRRYERAKAQGYAARCAGKPRELNPYRNKPSMRMEAAAWDDGFNDANVQQGRRRA